MTTCLTGSIGEFGASAGAQPSLAYLSRVRELAGSAIVKHQFERPSPSGFLARTLQSGAARRMASVGVKERSVYEVDFLPVKPEGKSGDAIAARFSTPTGSQAVIVIDGGFIETGYDLADHIRRWYGTSYVDLVINTHPDADHINGLTVVLEELSVGELLIHQPRQHGYTQAPVNPEAVDDLLDVARRRHVPVNEPFAGLQRFDGALTVLGPTQDYYKELLQEQLAERSLAARVASFYRKALVRSRRVLTALPPETLDNLGETTARNNRSVITQLTVDGRRLLFTGDAGIPALDNALDLLLLLFWWKTVTEAWVRPAAEAYADALLRSLDRPSHNQGSATGQESG